MAKTVKKANKAKSSQKAKNAKNTGAVKPTKKSGTKKSGTKKSAPKKTEAKKAAPEKPVKLAPVAEPVKIKKAAKPEKPVKAAKPAPAKSKKSPKKPNKEVVKKKTENKSATLLAVERQQKLEDTMPLGGAISQLTSELPVFGGNLDGPDRRPWKKIKLPKPDIDIAGKKILIVVAAVLVILTIAGVAIEHIFTVDTVTIEGSTHYSNEEICDMVMGGRFGHNSIYLSMKYKNKDIEDIPFIQTMNVSIVNPSTIKVTVYEKAMAGYVEYMGRYFYFDKDGTIIESSDVRTKGIPQVMGLDFDHIILYEKLPVESEEIFKNILEITQLLSKYDIEMDKVYFDKNFNMTLYFDEARIKIGDFANIDEKIIRLKDILPELEGKKGVLRLDNYSDSNGIITFELDSTE